MGQVLVVGIGVAGCALLQLAWHIWKRLVSVSTRPVHDNPRLRALAESESGEEYVRGIAELAAQNASEATRVAEEAQRQSDQAIRDKVRALHREAELTREVGRAKRRQRTLEAEGDPLLGLFWRGGKGPSVERLDEVRRETERIQEKAKKARQNSMEIVERVKVAQAVVEKTVREAEESTRTAKEVQADAEEYLKRGIRPVVIPTLEEISAAKKRVQYEQGRFHFAVAGVAGSGKSSFVNAIRGVDTQHQDAAESGIVETTVTIGRYPDPNPDLPFVWYDIPGAGTLQQPDWLYFNTQGLFVFDCVVVLFDNRFTETDIAILTNCRRFQIPTYIVRSKADIHIRNIMHKDGYDSDRDDRAVRESLFPDARRRFITDTRANVKKNLKKGGLPDQRVYMISNSTLLSIVRDRSLWTPHKIIDELELIKDILDEACSHRCAARANDDDCLV